MYLHWQELAWRTDVFVISALLYCQLMEYFCRCQENKYELSVGVFKQKLADCVFCATVTLLGREESCLTEILRMAQKWEQEGERSSSTEWSFLRKSITRQKGQ